MDNSICRYCKYRYSWDCDDMECYPKEGCENWTLDIVRLSDKQLSTIKKILIQEVSKTK